MSRRKTTIIRRDPTGKPVEWLGDDPPDAHAPKRARVYQPPRDLDERLKKLGIRNRRR